MVGGHSLDCDECGWAVETTADRQERSQRAVHHFCETGHSITADERSPFSRLKTHCLVPSNLTATD
ncbi:hypothetical protein [Haladaptatus sp. NG-WS-4]